GAGVVIGLGVSGPPIAMLMAYSGTLPLTEDRAALVVDDSTRDLSLDHVRFVHDAHGGTSLRGAEVLARMQSCAFESNGGWSVEAPADLVPRLSGNTFGEPVRVSGDVTRSASWAADVPVVIVGTVTVGAVGAAAAP